jgi:hypothetical protein
VSENCNLNIELLKQYLTKHFPKLELCSPLFYNAAIGIRFEIGSPEISFRDPRYLQFVHVRSQILFDQVFSQNDTIFLVVNSYGLKSQPNHLGNGLNVFRKYLANKNLYSEVGHVELPHVYGDEDLSTHRFALLCKTIDIDTKGLLTAIGNKDLGVQPMVDDEVFFINTENQVIFYLYDDRGLDIVAKEKRVLSDLYHRYNDWILAYDRREIDQVFS